MNKGIFTGRLTKAPELRYTANNTPVASFTLAVDRKVRQVEEKQADFIPVIAWAKIGEVCGKHLDKGSKVLVEGRIQTRTWDADGKKHYVTELILEKLEFLEKKKDSAGSQTVPDVVMSDDDELPF